MTDETLKAPFPYFGGKSRIASEVWRRLGADLRNYVEPFFGSGAMLLARPDWRDGCDFTETVNDLDAHVANFWRALQADPDAVAHYADWPVNENDLSARHTWLLGWRDRIASKLSADPDFYDAKAAGWWVWGLSSWIGSGWCSGDGPWRAFSGELVPLGRGNGGGVSKHIPHYGRGIHRQRQNVEGAVGGTCNLWSEHLRETMQQLADRLRRVRVCCGDWERVCSPAVTTVHGLTGIFFDPPYAQSERTLRLYTEDSNVARRVFHWCAARGGYTRRTPTSRGGCFTGAPHAAGTNNFGSHSAGTTSSTSGWSV